LSPRREALTPFRDEIDLSLSKLPQAHGSAGTHGKCSVDPIPAKDGLSHEGRSAREDRARFRPSAGASCLQSPQMRMPILLERFSRSLIVGSEVCDSWLLRLRRPTASGTRRHRNISVAKATGCCVWKQHPNNRSVNPTPFIRPISARSYSAASLRSSAAILVRRFVMRSITAEAESVSGRVRRNISRTCWAAWIA
jgi:hypothetical protein